MQEAPDSVAKFAKSAVLGVAQISGSCHWEHIVTRYIHQRRRPVVTGNL
jgi:hypothetical protein